MQYNCDTHAENNEDHSLESISEENAYSVLFLKEWDMHERSTPTVQQLLPDGPESQSANIRNGSHGTNHSSWPENNLYR